MIGSGVPPHNIDAERSVLGSILVDREIVPVVSDTLKAGDFYLESHNAIFNTCLDLYTNNAPIDLVSVTAKLREQGILEKVGGTMYIAELSGFVPVSSVACYHAGIVANHATVRRIIQQAEIIASKGYSGDFESATDFAAMAEESITAAAQQVRQQGLVRVGEMLAPKMREIEARKTGNAITGVETGYKMLDLWTGGFQPGELIIVAGRPSMGKTTWGVQVCAHATVRNKKKAAIFSLETSKEQLVEKLLVSGGRVPSQSVRIGKYTEEQHSKLIKAAQALSTAGLYIDDSASPSVAEIRAKCRRLQAEKGLDVVLIDYLTLIKPRKNRESRRLEVAEISAGLRIMAKELNIPVVVLSQLSREVEKRQIKKPVMSDLRDAGEIEQDAHVIIFLYREEKYNPKPENAGRATIILEKQRNGPTGEFNVTFEKSYTRFIDK